MITIGSRAARTAGGLRGCVAAATLIHTDQGLVPAARLARMRQPPQVACYRHFEQCFAWCRLLAVRAVQVAELWELRTEGGRSRSEGGRSLWATGDHPVFVVGSGYLPVSVIKPGSEVVAAEDVPPVLESREFRFPGSSKQETTRPLPVPAPRSSSEADEDEDDGGAVVPVPVRRKDWVTGNRRMRMNRLITVFDFQTESGTFVGDGLLLRHK